MTSSTPKPGQSLAEKRPDLAAQWHPTRNGDLTPDQVVAGTGKKLWWKCDAGPDHEWQGPPKDRLSRGCPFCRGRRVSVTNSLATLRPDLAAQWHPTLNGDLTPDQVVAGSTAKVWWRCDVGDEHEWQASLTNRTRGRNCPFCRGFRASVTNSLAALRPDLAAQWHPTLNGDLTPDQVVAGTNKKHWWKCPEGPDHEWQANGNSRVNGGNGCPFCAGLYASTTNSVASVPQLAAQWHPTKNGDLRPEDVVAGTERKLWWKCPKGPDHEWQASGRYRTTGRGCPFCTGKRVSTTNSVASVPELVAQWHPTKNGDLRPEDVVVGTARKLWWKCPKGPDHEWQASGHKRVNGRGCPFCRGLSVSVTNSVASVPELAAQWHPTKNGDLRPEDVVVGTARKLWWKCDGGPDHEWQATGHDRAAGRGCPACSVPGYNPTKTGFLYVLCGDDWGKAGISNVLAQRLAKHASGGAFGTFRIALEFADGTVPQRLEKALCAFIAERTDERAAVGIDGYTESFPALLLEDVLAELRRLLEELPTWERGRLVPSGYRLET